MDAELKTLLLWIFLGGPIFGFMSAVLAIFVFYQIFPAQRGESKASRAGGVLVACYLFAAGWIPFVFVPTLYAAIILGYAVAMLIYATQKG